MPERGAQIPAAALTTHGGAPGIEHSFEAKGNQYPDLPGVDRRPGEGALSIELPGIFADPGGVCVDGIRGAVSVVPGIGADGMGAPVLGVPVLGVVDPVAEPAGISVSVTRSVGWISIFCALIQASCADRDS